MAPRQLQFTVTACMFNLGLHAEEVAKPLPVLSRGGGVSPCKQKPQPPTVSPCSLKLYIMRNMPPPRGDVKTPPFLGEAKPPPRRGRSPLPGRGEASFHGRGEAPSMGGAKPPSWEGRSPLHGRGEAPFLGGAKLRPWEGQSPPTGRGDAHLPVIDYGSFIKDYTSI